MSKKYIIKPTPQMYMLSRSFCLQSISITYLYLGLEHYIEIKITGIIINNITIIVLICDEQSRTMP